MLERPGFYVEGRFFAHREAQAVAWARIKSDEYGRSIVIRMRNFDGSVSDYGSAEPGGEPLIRAA